MYMSIWRYWRWWIPGAGVTGAMSLPPPRECWKPNSSLQEQCHLWGAEPSLQPWMQIFLLENQSTGKTVNKFAIKEFWQSKEEIKHLGSKWTQRKQAESETKTVNKYATEHLNLISIFLKCVEMMFNLTGSVLSEYPSQARDPGRRRLGTCLSGTNCSSNGQKRQLHGRSAILWTGEQDSFPLSSLGLSPLLSQKVLKPPSPSMGNSCLPFKPQFGCQFLQDLSFDGRWHLPPLLFQVCGAVSP